MNEAISNLESKISSSKEAMTEYKSLIEELKQKETHTHSDIQRMYDFLSEHMSLLSYSQFVIDCHKNKK